MMTNAERILRGALAEAGWVSMRGDGRGWVAPSPDSFVDRPAPAWAIERGWTSASYRPQHQLVWTTTRGRLTIFTRETPYPWLTARIREVNLSTALAFVTEHGKAATSCAQCHAAPATVDRPSAVHLAMLVASGCGPDAPHHLPERVCTGCAEGAPQCT